MSDLDELVEDLEEDAVQQHLVFSVKEVNFAVAVDSVRELLPLPRTVSIPDSPPWMRGVINLRGETYKLVDFRIRLGMPGLQQELEEIVNELEQREREHREWVDQLEKAIREDQNFTGQTDPHKCNFGLWYDKFESNNGTVMLELKKFDEPHKLIHATAREALSLRDAGKQEEALELIERRRNGELARLVSLFDNLKRHIREEQKEVVVLLESGEDRFAITVDKVEAVEAVRESDERTLANFQQKRNGFVRYSKVAKRAKTDDIVYLVQPEWIATGSATGSEAIEE
jgi:purine-binding chemotaxis protein CheW